MRKIILASLIFSFASLAWGEEDLSPSAIDNEKVLGRWLTTRPVWTGSGVKAYGGIEFFPDSTAIISTICKYASSTLEAKTEALRAEVTAREIAILDRSPMVSVTDGTRTCSVDTETFRVRYDMRGSSRLRMFASPGAPKTAFRRR